MDRNLRNNLKKLFLLSFLFWFIACSAERYDKNDVKSSEIDTNGTKTSIDTLKIIVGAAQFEEYYEYIKGKDVAILANQSSLIDSVHLLDFLLEKEINVKKVFSPEHGFRGTIDRGREYEFEVDSLTGIQIIPVYGNNRKPQSSQLEDVDVVLFDIQDVGVRFYTYISTMHYMMEACAENGKTFVVLDRPNPLGDYVDGPVLKDEFKSFVGMHNIPVVHGLTVGELAMMINGEHWLADSLKCKLHVVKVKNYRHADKWHLNVKPSPNLPNDLSIRLYPSLCFFEASEISIGRGTEFPFQVIGYPDENLGDFQFIPRDIPGMQMNPVQEDMICYGLDLRDKNEDIKFTLQFLLDFSVKFNKSKQFISNRNWFDLLAGNSELADQIISGMSEADIKKTWQKDLMSYKNLRKKYLLYIDFE